MNQKSKHECWLCVVHTWESGTLVFKGYETFSESPWRLTKNSSFVPAAIWYTTGESYQEAKDLMHSSVSALAKHNDFWRSVYKHLNTDYMDE